MSQNPRSMSSKETRPGTYDSGATGSNGNQNPVLPNPFGNN